MPIGTSGCPSPDQSHHPISMGSRLAKVTPSPAESHHPSNPPSTSQSSKINARYLGAWFSVAPAKHTQESSDNNSSRKASIANAGITCRPPNYHKNMQPLRNPTSETLKRTPRTCPPRTFGNPQRHSRPHEVHQKLRRIHIHQGEADPQGTPHIPRRARTPWHRLRGGQLRRRTIDLPCRSM